jgi:ACS family hexuronate transporter-like MFS transporter
LDSGGHYWVSSESGNFPAAIKTIAEWFPKKERALATGIFNSGANVGAIVAPVAVPAIVIAWGWQAAFIITGCYRVTYGSFFGLSFMSYLKNKENSHRE